jgi:deoxyribodipyrimidine photo-lyase
MSRDQRVHDNWALLYAQEQALTASKPLVVLFVLAPSFLGATWRQYDFMIKGLELIQEQLKSLGIGFVCLSGDAEEVIPAFVSDLQVSLLISDFSPLRISRQWKTAIASKISIPFREVDAHNIVPPWIASDRLEYAARTFRPRIHKKLPHFLVEFPAVVHHPYQQKNLPEISWDAFIQSLSVDRSVPPVSWCSPGEKAALENLNLFISKRLAKYDSDRNDPSKDGLSNVSVWLHYGMISAQRCVLETSKLASKYPKSVATFQEELVVRRELSENFCFYNPDGYDRLDGLYPTYQNNSWAQQTLREHAKDKREKIYSFEQLQKAQTSDDLWNASQMEMVHLGKMHGYLRMYWAKKILEWTPSPEEALRIAIALNDKYELDGRDPNGYVGCAWAIAGLHDQGWKERPVFGKIRYMNYEGCKRKFNVQAYVNKINKLIKSVS